MVLDLISLKESLTINEITSLKPKWLENQNNTGTTQKSTKSVFLNKLSKKSENKQAPLNIKGNSNKSRNIGLKEIGCNAYSNNQPTWARNDIIGYELSSSNSYSIAGRTMVHQINTPKKYSIIHANGGGGLFASYNRSIPKNGVPQTNKIKINDFYDQNKSAINKPANKIQKYIDGNKKCKSKIKSIRENSNSQDDNYQDEYSQIIRNEMKEKVLIRANLKKDNEISECCSYSIPPHTPGKGGI